MKEQFQESNFRAERLETIERANQIIAEYDAMNLRLTLRQLYYQFVTKNWLTNTERSYKNLGTAISDGRLAGLIDWDAIEDRVRVPRRQSEWDDLRALVDSALWAYRLPRWAGQKFYLELWVEKDALAGVLEPIASEYHVTLMVNRGYSSQSAMYGASKRFLEQIEANKEPVLLYLGDHDPSGEDMVRDVRDRLYLFGATVEVKKVALTMEQVEQYEPPPNPAKLSDSRAAKYVDQHGDESWEVDALPPNVLTDLIRNEIRGYVDLQKMQAVKDKEKVDKDALTKAAEKIVRRNGHI